MTNEEKAIEVYKWILFNVNGFTRQEIEELDFNNEYCVWQIEKLINGEKFDYK